MNADALESLPPFPTLICTTRRSGSTAPMRSIRAGVYNFFVVIFFQILLRPSCQTHLHEKGGSRWLFFCTACPSARSSARVVVLRIYPLGVQLSNMTSFLRSNILPVPFACLFPGTVLMDVQVQVLFPSSVPPLDWGRSLRITARKGRWERIACHH